MSGTTRVRGRARPLTIVASIGLFACSMGCAGGGAPSRIAPRPPEARSLDTVASSSLRERAIVLIERSCKDQDPRVRANAVEAAGYAPNRLLESIRTALRDENVGVRSVAAMTVGRHRLRALMEDARPLAGESDAYAATSGIYALAMNGDPIDRSPLAAYLLNDPSIRVRSHVVFLIGEMGDASAVPLLREAGRKRVSKAAQAELAIFQLQLSEAMVKLGVESQLEPLRAALYPSRAEDLEGTALAVQALGQVKDRGAIDQLVYLSAAKDQQGNLMPAEVRLAVAGSLAKLGLPKGDFIADEFVKSSTPTLRSQAASVYGETRSPDNLGILRAMLDDPDGGVRVAAAASVVKITNR